MSVTLTGIGTQQEHSFINHLIHAGEMHNEDREETAHITDLLQTAILSSGQQVSNYATWRYVHVFGVFYFTYTNMYLSRFS